MLFGIVIFLSNVPADIEVHCVVERVILAVWFEGRSTCTFVAVTKVFLLLAPCPSACVARFKRSGNVDELKIVSLLRNFAVASIAQQ